MPGWGIAVLKWGGLALAVANLIAIVWVLAIGAEPAVERTANGDAAPYTAYIVLASIGLMAAFLGFLMDRRRRPRPR